MTRRGVVESLLYVGALGAIVVMAVSNWQLRQRLQDTTALLHARRPAMQKLQAGQRLAPFPARDRQGRAVTVGRNAEESLLVVVDPNCGSCEKVLDELRATPWQGVAVVALVPSLETKPKVAVADGTPLYTISRASAPQFVRRLDGVPRVIRVAPDGMVGAVCSSLKECA
ncbi:MAG TPA: hypothetical protein VFV49_15310 [Thermoanaerobaculia bacterium]|nr:hypothetical protein [Thermoanaerobaculia bacterium]